MQFSNFWIRIRRGACYWMLMVKRWCYRRHTIQIGRVPLQRCTCFFVQLSHDDYYDYCIRTQTILKFQFSRCFVEWSGSGIGTIFCSSPTVPFCTKRTLLDIELLKFSQMLEFISAASFRGVENVIIFIWTLWSFVLVLIHSSAPFQSFWVCFKLIKYTWKWNSNGLFIFTMNNYESDISAGLVW